MDTPDKLHQQPRQLPLDWLRPQTVTKPDPTQSAKGQVQQASSPTPLAPQAMWPLAPTRTVDRTQG